MKYSLASQLKLATCHPELQRLFREVIKHVDCTIICGVRSEGLQEEYLRTGRSKTLNSKHLMKPDGYSHAVDVAVCKIDWEDSERNYAFAFYVQGIADMLGIRIRKGADWDGDFILNDQTFNDLVHFELVGGSDGS